MAVQISSLAQHLSIFTTEEAFRSWIKSQRRLFKTLCCPICGHRAKVRRGFLLCSLCNRGWPLDDIQDLISEIEATGEAGGPSQVKPGPAVSPTVNPGLYYYKE